MHDTRWQAGKMRLGPLLHDDYDGVDQQRPLDQLGGRQFSAEVAVRQVAGITRGLLRR